MKRKILSGLAGLCLGLATLGGCEEKQEVVQYLEREKADISLNLRALEGICDLTFIVNEKDNYLFIKDNGKYRLLRIEPSQKTALVIGYENTDNEPRTFDLGDFNTYLFSYNPESKNHELSVKTK